MSDVRRVVGDVRSSRDGESPGFQARRPGARMRTRVAQSLSARSGVPRISSMVPPAVLRLRRLTIDGSVKAGGR